MKTIDEYKADFIKLAKQLEQEHGFTFSTIVIESKTNDHITQFGQEFSTYTYSCKICTK